MADNRQILIHLHTEDVKVPAPELIELGEIAVQHNDSEAALYVKKNGGEISKFIDSSAVDSKVNAEKTRAEGVESTLNTAITTEKTRAEGAEEALSDRIDSLTGSSHSHDNKTVLDGVTAEKVAAWDAAEQNAKDYADGLAVNYDAAGAAAGVKSWVEEQNYLKAHQDISGLATKTEVSEAEGRASAYTDAEIAKLGDVYDAKGAAGTAEQNAKDYADGLASNYDAAGAAADVKSWVEEQNYLKTHQDISGLATKTEVAEAEGRASAYTDTEIAKLGDVYATKSAVETLVGSDVDKSVRTVAAEEVAKVVANADADFDTLKEIADWIQNDTTGAAKMANDIKELQNVNADSRLDALEAISGESHTHSNKALLDTYTQTEVDLADAVAKKHEHTNKVVLDGVTAEKVAAWDAAEQNAKDYADGLAVNYDAAGAAADVKSWVEGQNYLKTHQDISGLATKAEVSEAEGRASAYTDAEIAKLGDVYDAKGAAAAVQSWVEGQNYLTEHQDISTLATKTEVAEAEGRASAYTDTEIAKLSDVYDAKGAAGTAETNANSYTDTKISTLRIDCGTF